MKREVYNIAASLLQYPDETWLNDLKSLKDYVDQLKDAYIKNQLYPFIHYLEKSPFHILCENYVETFDYNGFVTLHLTHHVFKDSRKRGEALIQLRKLMNDSDVMPLTDELPDYLPLILEFLTMASLKDVKRVLSLHHKAIDYLYEQLKQNDNVYQYVLEAVRYVSEEFISNKDVS